MQIFRSLPTGKLSTSTLASSPSATSGLGKSTIVREGCRSASPESTSSAISTQASGTHAMCVMTLVRWNGSPVSGSIR